MTTSTKPTASVEIKTMYDTIEKLMLEDVELRNNERKLIIEIWENEIPKGFFIETLNSQWNLFSHLFTIGKLTSTESICRIARDVRKKNGWKIPKKEEENKVKQVLKYESNLFPPVDLEFLNIRK